MRIFLSSKVFKKKIIIFCSSPLNSSPFIHSLRQSLYLNYVHYCIEINVIISIIATRSCPWQCTGSASALSTPRLSEPRSRGSPRGNQRLLHPGLRIRVELIRFRIRIEEKKKGNGSDRPDKQTHTQM